MAGQKYTFKKFLKSLFTIDFYKPKHLAKFFDDKGGTKEEFYFDVLLIILILLSSVFFVLETYTLAPWLFVLVRSLDVLAMLFFTFELVARLYANKNNHKYWWSFSNIIDVLAVVPFWLAFIIPGIGSLQFIRVFRLLKVFRYFDKYFNKKYVPKKLISRIVLLKLAATMFVLLYVSAGLFYTFESGLNPNIATFDDALYFALVTVTTVGFGDITPVTKIGQMIVMLIIIAGVFSIPIYMSALLKTYIGQKNKKKIPCKVCGLQYHDENAVHCKMCGNIIFQEFNDGITP